MSGWSWTYAILMLASVFTGVVVSRWSGPSIGLNRTERWAIALGAFCGGVIGAKLPFLFMDWSEFVSGRAWLDNGKTILWGLAGGYLGVELAKWTLNIRTKTGDSLAAPVAAAIAVGRLSCFAAGCCFGTQTRWPWGIDFGDGLRRHPTQIYEFAFHACCVVILIELRRRGLFRRQLAKLYILAYLAYRFLTEFIRPEPRMALGLTFYQWSAAALVPIFVGLWLRDRERVRVRADRPVVGDSVAR